MTNKFVEVVIKLAGQEEPIEAEVDTTNPHDIDNWLMGRRFLKVLLPNPEAAPSSSTYTLECRLGPDLGKTAQITFLN